MKVMRRKLISISRATVLITSLGVLLIKLLIFSFANSEVLTAEGSVKYIGKPTSYSPPYILLSSSQRFYTTLEIYNHLLTLKEKYLYFKLKGNKITDFSEDTPKDYVYTFPEIMKIDKFEFDNYLAFYVRWYFNFSPFVEIKSIDKGISLFYTSPNSLTIKLPRNYDKKTLTLIATYINKKIKQQKKYIIKLK